MLLEPLGTTGRSRASSKAREKAQKKGYKAAQARAEIQGLRQKKRQGEAAIHRQAWNVSLVWARKRYRCQLLVVRSSLSGAVRALVSLFDGHTSVRSRQDSLGAQHVLIDDVGVQQQCLACSNGTAGDGNDRLEDGYLGDKSSFALETINEDESSTLSESRRPLCDPGVVLHACPRECASQFVLDCSKTRHLGSCRRKVTVTHCGTRLVAGVVTTLSGSLFTA